MGIELCRYVHTILVCCVVRDANLTAVFPVKQVNGDSMVSITHDEAVSILKAVKEIALLRIEKNAINISSLLTTDEEEEEEEEQEEVCVHALPLKCQVML